MVKLKLNQKADFFGHLETMLSEKREHTFSLQYVIYFLRMVEEFPKNIRYH